MCNAAFISVKLAEIYNDVNMSKNAICQNSICLYTVYAFDTSN